MQPGAGRLRFASNPRDTEAAQLGAVAVGAQLGALAVRGTGPFTAVRDGGSCLFAEPRAEPWVGGPAARFYIRKLPIIRPMAALLVVIVV